MRLIDADELIKSYLDHNRTEFEIKNCCMANENVIAIITNAPTVDITEEQAIDKLHETGWLPRHDKEMTERPTGHWIEHYDTEDGFTWLTCSRCMFKAYEEDYNFCPNCGADMRKEEEE